MKVYVEMYGKSLFLSFYIEAFHNEYYLCAGRWTVLSVDQCQVLNDPTEITNQQENTKAVKYTIDTYWSKIERNASIIAEVFRWLLVDISVEGLRLSSHVSGTQVPIISRGLSMSTLGHYTALDRH